MFILHLCFYNSFLKHNSCVEIKHSLNHIRSLLSITVKTVINIHRFRYGLKICPHLIKNNVLFDSYKNIKRLIWLRYILFFNGHKIKILISSSCRLLKQVFSCKSEIAIEQIKQNQEEYLLNYLLILFNQINFQ